MWKLVIMAIMLLMTVGFLLFGIGNVIRLIVKKMKKKVYSSVIKLLKVDLLCLVGILLLIVIFTGITQLTAYTPKIKGADGKELEGSIAELRKVTLNGRKEWITIRGNDKTAPILLFLAGGPGGSQLAATRANLSELEKHFVVVNWDQPGSGKSYDCMNRKKITPQTYIEDGIALTEQLREEFGQDKIYVIGESWGSALGIFLISEKPEYYKGFIGMGQMVDFAETDRLNYQMAMDLATQDHDQKLIDKLIKEGQPPYDTGNISLRSLTYFNRLNTYMAKHPDKQTSPFHTLQDLGGSEYGLLDSLRYPLGVMNTYNVLWPQLCKIDLRKDYAKLEVPVYFFLGSFDVNAPTSLVEDYYSILEAPKKEIVWFEHSGHTPWQYETDRFVKELLARFQ